MRNFGWPLFAYAIFAPLSTYIMPSGRSREEKTTRLLFVGGVIAIIEAVFFLGTESADAFAVARLNPAWGIYALLLLLIAVGGGSRWAVARARENRTVIRISGNTNIETPGTRLRTNLYAGGFAIWTIALIFGILWLARIAKAQ